jgi:hypothetical protein
VARNRPLSEGRNNKAGAGCLILFGAVFAGMGLFFLYMVLIVPLKRMAEAKSWDPTPCTIVESKVGSRRGSEGGTTYGVEVKYEYQYNGRTYTGERYQVSTVYSSGRSGKQAVVDSLPAGKKTTCFVDPDKPERSVLDRSAPTSMWFSLITLPFILVGLGIIWAGLYKRKKEEGPLSERAGGLFSGKASWPTIEQKENGQVVLKPKSTRVGKFIALTVFALIWNGFVGSFVVVSWGSTPWFVMIFLGIFQLIGIGIIGAAVHSLLAIFNPMVEITLEGADLEPGEAEPIAWQVVGNPARLQNLKISLIGQEEATYQRGTNSVTERHEFFCLTILSTEDPSQIGHGSQEISLPAGAMHSFSANKNKIVYMLKVESDIPRWPDICDEYDLNVTPAHAPMTSRVI